jgi:hypothetical protein
MKGKKSKKVIIFTWCVLFIVLWQVHENSLVEVLVPSSEGQNITLVMPWKDKKNLEYLFYKMTIRDEGGYTLFGTKPMHMNVYLNPFSLSTWKNYYSAMSLNHLRTYLGWKTCQKYQHLFENSNFVFLSEKNPFWEEVCKASNISNPNVAILLINKVTMREVVEKYKHDFQNVLVRKNISYTKLLQEAQDKPFLQEVLQNHDGLIGTVFGFGRENAWLFEERKQGKNATQCVSLWDKTIYEFFSNRPTFTWKWFGFCSDDYSNVVGYPTCCADPDSQETQELKEQFLQTRQKIIDYYKGKKFFEATLSILINSENPLHDQKPSFLYPL